MIYETASYPCQVAQSYSYSDGERLATQLLPVGVDGGEHREHHDEGEQRLDPQPLPHGHLGVQHGDPQLLVTLARRYPEIITSINK